jgi:hypothetical protein
MITNQSASLEISRVNAWSPRGLPCCLMLTPTTAELLNAIQVLNKLGERINTSAFNSVLQLSETNLGNHNAGQIGVTAIEQISRIKIVAGQLENWGNELIQQRRQNVS